MHTSNLIKLPQFPQFKPKHLLMTDGTPAALASATDIQALKCFKGQMESMSNYDSVEPAYRDAWEAAFERAWEMETMEGYVEASIRFPFLLWTHAKTVSIQPPLSLPTQNKDSIVQKLRTILELPYQAELTLSKTFTTVEDSVFEPHSYGGCYGEWKMPKDFKTHSSYTNFSLTDWTLMRGRVQIAAREFTATVRLATDQTEQFHALQRRILSQADEVVSPIKNTIFDYVSTQWLRGYSTEHIELLPYGFKGEMDDAILDMAMRAATRAYLTAAATEFSVNLKDLSIKIRVSDPECTQSGLESAGTAKIEVLASAPEHANHHVMVWPNDVGCRSPDEFVTFIEAAIKAARVNACLICDLRRPDSSRPNNTDNKA